jgi:hypothetical protein
MTDSALRQKQLLAAALAAALLVSACRDAGNEGDLFEIGGKLFVFNYRIATATYLVNLVPLRPIQDAQTAVVSFEDPAGGADIVVRQKIWPATTKTTVESPPVNCIVKGRRYAVSIRIEAADGKVLQRIETTMASSQDQNVLPDRPLVVGPLYTRNPEPPDSGALSPACPEPADRARNKQE